MVHKIKKEEKTIDEELMEMYDFDVPKYLKVLSKNRIQIRAGQWEGAPTKWITITPKDVINYYRQDNPMGCAGMSGARTLAGFTTDWRMVDNMAKESLEIFKRINRPALVKEGKMHGMELKN